MPKKLERCVKKITSKGTPKDVAFPVCIKSTGQKPHKKKSKK